MRRLAVMAVALAATTGAAMADPIEGTWRMPSGNDARIASCGDGFCLTNNSRDRLNRELSYPAVHEAPDGSLDVAYTWHRQTIKHVRIPAGWRQGA